MTPRMSQAITELTRRFPGGEMEMMSAFNPGNQTRFCQDVDKVHFGKAPQLKVITAAYGLRASVVWLSIQLNDLAEFAGCREKLRQSQMDELAAIIATGYGHMKLTELMLFFLKIKRGEYGKFYGAIDPMMILGALQQFEEYRCTALRNKLRQQEQQQKERQAAEAEAEHERLRARYLGRIPDGRIKFHEYVMNGYDRLSDAELEEILQEDGDITEETHPGS